MSPVATLFFQRGLAARGSVTPLYGALLLNLCSFLGLYVGVTKEVLG